MPDALSETSSKRVAFNALSVAVLPIRVVAHDVAVTSLVKFETVPDLEAVIV
jgi:hypothetical protein